MTLYFITGNKNKFTEISKIIPDIKQLSLDLTEIQSLDAKEVIKHKLKEALKHRKDEFIVEDTSLYLECLNGFPGPLIKYFLAAIKQEGIFNLCDKLKNNKAKATTIIGYTNPAGEIHLFEHTIEGEIVSVKGDLIFGWNQIFKPKGENKTFGEMSLEEKGKISMRGKAAQKLKDFLDKQ